MVTTLMSILVNDRAKMVHHSAKEDYLKFNCKNKVVPREQLGRGNGYVEHALSLLENHSYRQVEEMTGISKSTLIRRKNEKRAKELKEE